MSCINNCRLCNNLVISDAVTFADNTLTINLPSQTYQDNGKYCIVIAQTIPDTVTISSPVVFTIGTDTTTTYPFVNQCCEPVLASQVRTRRLYQARVSTSIATGVFKYIGNNLPLPSINSASSLPITTETSI